MLLFTLQFSVRKIQRWGFIYLYHPYLVCIHFDMPSLHLVLIANIVVNVGYLHACNNVSCLFIIIIANSSQFDVTALSTLVHLQVEATLLNNPPAPVIEYTLIPIDTSNCQRPTLSK